jgi:fimbrial chaperone protein
MKKLFIFFIIGVGCLISLPGLTSSLQVFPVQVYIEPNKTNSSFTITNPAKEDLLLQLNIIKWTQNNGQDIYKPTKDMLVNPPVINLPAGKTQLVRVGSRISLNRQQEQSYRIFIKEVPKMQKKPDGITPILEINLPVFLEPMKKKKNLVWSAKAAKNGVNVKLKNKSNIHIQISNLEILQVGNNKPLLEQSTFVYLLPGQQKVWNLNLNTPVKGNNITLKAQTDWGEVFENMELSQQ